MDEVRIDSMTQERLSIGASFGKLSLLGETDEQRTLNSTIVAGPACVCALLTREQYHAVRASVRGRLASVLSTPFLNWRWFLAVLGRKDSAAYKYTSLAFALTFLLTRIGGYGLGLAHLWAQRALWAPAATGLYVTIAGVHAGFALNLFWSVTVVRNLAKAVRTALAPPPARAIKPHAN